MQSEGRAHEESEEGEAQASCRRAAQLSHPQGRIPGGRPGPAAVGPGKATNATIEKSMATVPKSGERGLKKHNGCGEL